MNAVYVNCIWAVLNATSLLWSVRLTGLLSALAHIYHAKKLRHIRDKPVWVWQGWPLLQGDIELLQSAIRRAPADLCCESAALPVQLNILDQLLDDSHISLFTVWVSDAASKSWGTARCTGLVCYQREPHRGVVQYHTNTFYIAPRLPVAEASQRVVSVKWNVWVVKKRLLCVHTVPERSCNNVFVIARSWGSRIESACCLRSYSRGSPYLTKLAEASTFVFEFEFWRGLS